MIYAFSPQGVAALAAVLEKDPLFAFDIDGTLAPIVARPDEARLPDRVHACLSQLAQRKDVAVITGRGVDDARRMLRFDPHFLIGNHGAEGLPGWSERSGAFRRIVDGWRTMLDDDAALRASGVTVEHKRFSLSLHYRQAPDPYAADRAIRAALARLSPPPKVIGGKAVVNMLPAEAPDKGDAMRVLLQHTRHGDALYVGDDDTDETVFRLALPNVLSVRVEPAADSRATLYLREQGEVLTLLQHIVGQM